MLRPIASVVLINVRTRKGKTTDLLVPKKRSKEPNEGVPFVLNQFQLATAFIVQPLMSKFAKPTLVTLSLIDLDTAQKFPLAKFDLQQLAAEKTTFVINRGALNVPGAHRLAVAVTSQTADLPARAFAVEAFVLQATNLHKFAISQNLK
jgi:hypothetical protein